MHGIDLSQYQLDRPMLLWVGVVVMLFFLLGERGLIGWPRSRLFASTLVRCFAFLALVVALSGPHRFEDQPDLSLVFVVDASGSSSGGRLQRYHEILDDWWEQTGDVPARIVSAGEELREFDTPRELRQSIPAVHERTESDLGPALELAMESFEPASSRRLVLLSDGAVTGGWVDRAAAVAAIRGIRIYPIPPDEGMVTVAAGRLDTGVSTVLEGDEAKLTLTVVASDPVTGAVTLRDPEGRTLARREQVAIQRGETIVELSFTAGSPGIQALEALVEVEGDLFATDDIAYGALEIVGTPRVLIASRPEEARRFAPILSSLDPPLPHETVSASLPGSLDGVDLLVWIDPDFENLPADRPRLLRKFVRRGGRLIVIGGEHGLEVEEEGQDDLEELLPVRFPKTERKEPTPLVVVYCIDQSDSMGRAAKFEIALTAVVESMALLDPESKVGVVTFSDLPRWSVPVTEADQVEAVRARLGELAVYGGTSVYPALQLAYEALIEEEAQLKHVILLTDGRSVSTLKRDGEVVHNMARRDFTLSTVAIGRESDREQLEQVAAIGGGRFYYTEDFSTIPQIFLEETMTVVRSNKIDQRIDVHAVEDSPFLAGIDPEQIPPLEGYIRSMQRTTSELALATERGEPLLLHWRHGRGVVTLFTSDLDGPWSEPWSEWKQRSKLWRSVVAETLSPLPSPDVSLTAEIVGEQLRFEYSILDALKNPRNDLVVDGRIHEPGGTERTVRLQASGPGRYAAVLAVPAPGGYLVTVDAVERSQRSVDASGGAVPGGKIRASTGTPPPAETRAGSLNRTLLKRLADETGGQMEPSFAAVLEQDVDNRQVRVDAWASLLWAALVLFGVDIAVRRLRIPGRS